MPRFTIALFTIAKRWKQCNCASTESKSEVVQSSPTLCHPMDCSLTGSSVHGIFLARVLEWGAISFSRDLPDPGVEPRSPALHADALLPELPVQFSGSVMSNSLQPHRLQHARLPCPSPTPRAYSNSCPSHQWCHPTVSSSVICFSSLQSFPASGSFPVSQLFPSDGRSNGVSASASVPPMNIQA